MVASTRCYRTAEVAEQLLMRMRRGSLRRGVSRRTDGQRGQVPWLADGAAMLVGIRADRRRIGRTSRVMKQL